MDVGLNLIALNILALNLLRNTFKKATMPLISKLLALDKLIK